MTLMLPAPSPVLRATDQAVFLAGHAPGQWQLLPLRHVACGGVWQIKRRTEIDGWPTLWGTTRCSKCRTVRPVSFPAGHPVYDPTTPEGDPL